MSIKHFNFYYKISIKSQRVESRHVLVIDIFLIYEIMTNPRSYDQSVDIWPSIPPGYLTNPRIYVQSHNWITLWFLIEISSIV